MKKYHVMYSLVQQMSGLFTVAKGELNCVTNHHSACGPVFSPGRVPCASLCARSWEAKVSKT